MPGLIKRIRAFYFAVNEENVMQQGHPRHKQLNRSIHEMCLNRQRNNKRTLDNMAKAIRAVGQAYGRAIRNTFNKDK